MTLNEFKNAFGIEKINLYPSKSSSRLVAGFNHKGENKLIVTTKEFNTSGDIYVYENADQETGEIYYVLSNKEPKQAVAVL